MQGEMNFPPCKYRLDDKVKEVQFIVKRVFLTQRFAKPWKISVFDYLDIPLETCPYSN